MNPNNLKTCSLYEVKYTTGFLILIIASILNFVLATSTNASELNIPIFNAKYDIRMNGVTVGKAHFSITKNEDSTYLYQQKSKAKGIASWFTKEKVTESSLWKIHDDKLKPIEYHFTKSGSDDDEEDHIFFDLDAKTATNKSPTEPWSIEITEGTLDKLAVQVAMLLDIQNGETEFKYPIADNGRLKHYEFGILGEETIDVPGGEFKTTKLQRLDDDRDTTYIWTAPKLKHLPVRFLKIKKSGLKLEIRLREIQMQNI